MRVISKPTEKTTGELVALMFKLPIQLFPMKASLPHARKTTFKPLPILQLLFSCNLVLPEFSCLSKLWARLVSATTLTKDQSTLRPLCSQILQYYNTAVRGFLSRDISSKGNIWTRRHLPAVVWQGEGGVLLSSWNISQALSIMECLQTVKNTERLSMRVFLKIKVCPRIVWRQQSYFTLYLNLKYDIDWANIKSCQFALNQKRIFVI